MATISRDAKSKEPAAKHVKAVIRTRPTADFAANYIKFDSDLKSTHIHIPRGSDGGFINNQQENWDFKFDSILHNASQEKVFDECALGIVKSVMDGYHGTIMAYGQTGAGKTFTMFVEAEFRTGATENYKHRGLIPRAISHIFKEISERPQMAFTARISYLEIYNESIVDLLISSPESAAAAAAAGEFHSDWNLNVVDDKNGMSYVKGLTMQLANNEEEALNLLFEGETNRSIAQHQLNKISTRSRVESTERVISSKLNLVDLAGSERISKTHTQGLSMKEAMYINKSLTFLEQVIIALSDKRRDHIPYRQSKLTNVLRDSLGGNCNTLMIANIWGVKEHIEETISTLRFATRMMCVANTPSVNIQYDPAAMIKKYEKEIRELKQELAMHDSLNNRSHIQYESFGETQRLELSKIVKAYLKDEIDELEIVSLRQVREYFTQFKGLYKTLEQERNDLGAAVKKSNASGIAPAGGLAGDRNLAIDEYSAARMLQDYDRDDCVGETESSGFSVGLAPTNGKDFQFRSNMKKKKFINAGNTGNAKTISTQILHGEDDDDVVYERDINSPSHQMLPALPKTSGNSNTIGHGKKAPVNRADEFENFKRGKGAEMNRILIENKASLKEKKRYAISLSTQITAHKSHIDELKVQIDSRRMTTTNASNSETIIDEEEYTLIDRLKSVKIAYREAVESLKGARGEITYIEKLVVNVRQKLMSEFEAWFEGSFGIGGGGDDNLGGNNGGMEDLMDIGEKFDRLQLEKMSQEDPDSLPFYNARKNTERRMLRVKLIILIKFTINNLKNIQKQQK
ncbi:Kinesin-like protein kif9 [Physocladia obscura]|uniref:Kinesin-like protein n=1 Tax=Physocladia obscura TaxID=109957 RepID=A0AAD5T6M7_9FUNG|nr:Kinesin-like protein kif9 [Physocladia obscura]